MHILIIVVGKYLVYLLILIALIFVVTQPRNLQKSIVLLAIPGMILSYLVAFIAGKLYYDPRPFVVHHVTPLIAHAANNGFPSDHALISFTIATIVFIFNKKWGIGLGIMGLVIGIGRVSAGIHSPIDIGGSFIISVLTVYLVHYVLIKTKILMYNTSHD